MLIYRAYCDFPANDRAVFVTAISEGEAGAKIRACISLIYGCEENAVSFYNIFNELDMKMWALDAKDPYAVFVCGGNGVEDTYLEEPPVFLLPPEHTVITLWEQLKQRRA